MPCPTKVRFTCILSSAFVVRKIIYVLEIFGGASAMTPAQFRLVNGFSNQYWGWGGEDDDMYKRIDKSKLNIQRYKATISR